MSLAKRLAARVSSYHFILWWSIIWGVAVMALLPIVNYLTPLLNSGYANQWTPDIYWRLVMYWHGGIFIPWITALAVVVSMTFKLDKTPGFSGRLVRDSVFYGGLIAVPVAGIAGLFDVYDNFAWGVPLWTQIFAFLIGDEMALALILAFLMKPRASGTRYLKAGLPYYSVLTCVGSALIAAVMGHVGGWITWFGPYPSIVPQYVNSTIGYYNDTALVTFTENAVGSHSHLMLVALMAGIVSLAAVFYGFESWSKSKKAVAGLGFIIMDLALVATVVIYIISGVGNFAIPTLFTSGPGGVNGIAEDDIVTGIVGLGALFILIGLLANSGSRGGDGKPLYKDPMFLSIVSAWLIIFIVIPATGYYIELNHAFYTAGGAANDAAYTRFHQDFAFFFLPALVTVAIGLGRSGISGPTKRLVGSLFLIGEMITFVFGETYALVTLDMVTLAVAVFGAVLMGLGGLIAVRYLLTVREATTPATLPQRA
jgi:hypothetical protein